jgi:hypothetical protein
MVDNMCENFWCIHREKQEMAARDLKAADENEESLARSSTLLFLLCIRA